MEFKPIIKLSDEVIGQIAAGEVVERPAAAVKELVENSIDAGATAVTVELKDGGITYLRVSDNGRGIPAGQVRMAFERHATSKLRTAEELFSVRTLGFRGEALASIAAIARVTCVTRAINADFGVKAQVDAGVMGEMTEAASPIGTTVTVRDLFYNAPVRLKFLKKPVAEAGLVSDYIMRLILSRPDIAFRFVSQGKTVYRSAGDGTLESALYCVYGRETLRAMQRVQGTSGGVVVEGFVGVGEQARGNRLQQSFFINGRYFRSELISKALENACEGFVMIGRHPICALTLTMPYHLVDVNVHPNKLEVRFQNPEAVARAVETLTQEALRAVTMQDKLFGTPDEPPQTDADSIRLLPLQAAEDAPYEVQPQPDVAPRRIEGERLLPAKTEMGEAGEPGNASLTRTLDAFPPEPRNRQADAPTLREPAGIANSAGEQLLAEPDPRLLVDKPMGESVSATYVSDAPEYGAPDDDYAAQGEEMRFTPLPKLGYAAANAPTQTMQTAPQPVQERMESYDARVPLRFVGVVFKTYLLFEAGERLLMVDQHAAHERVLYDRFMARYESANISQRLLAPQMIRLTARDVALLSEMADQLTEAGFELEAFDATSVAVRAIPVILGENEPVRDLLLDVLDETQTQRGKITRERLRRRVTQMACKHAIKAGDTLRSEDVRLMLEHMLATGAQPTCPHGRPIVSELTRRELEKRFKRIQ